MSILLLETLSTGRAGEPVYYRHWTDIGPACTRQFGEAEIFESVTAARLSPAYSFGLTSFEPYLADEDAIWDALTDPGPTQRMGRAS